MPLLRKKPFQKKDPPRDLKPEDKVFYCDLTQEVFTYYEEYWQRVALCNALVWSCELTGKPNLTFKEALYCEAKAKKCLGNLAPPLKRGCMVVLTYTKRSSFLDASDDVFSYVRDRYLVGEEVEAIVNKHWYDCKVVSVVMPTRAEVQRYEEAMAESDEEEDVDDIPSDDDIQVIRDDHNPQKVVNGKLPSPKTEKEAVVNETDPGYPPFAAIKYEVVEKEPWDYKTCKNHIVSWEQIRRNKSAFTREKCKLFLKQCVYVHPEGYWALKAPLAKKLEDMGTSFASLFVGNPPKFEEAVKRMFPISPKAKEKPLEREREKKRKEKMEEISKKKVHPQMTEEEKNRQKELQQLEKDKLKEVTRERLERKKEERRKEKLVTKEAARLMKMHVMEWKSIREDLDCDDLKELPQFWPVRAKIPQKLFGDFIMLLEFVNVFTELLELHDVYPHGITFDMLEHALLEVEVAGVFNDVMQLLLGAIFTLQEEEDEEVKADDKVEISDKDMKRNPDSQNLVSAVEMANKVSVWSLQHLGIPLQKAPLDALTLTEVLRLHLLASGATNVANAVWRMCNRGGYKNTDDPGLHFKIEEPAIIKDLESKSIFELPIEHKMKILHLLMAQILTYASVRDTIEDRIEKLKEMKNNLRMKRITEHKVEQSFRLQKKKEKEEMMNKLKKGEEKSQDIKKVEEKLRDQSVDENQEKNEEKEQEGNEKDAVEGNKEEEAAAADGVEEERRAREEKARERQRNDFIKIEREIAEKLFNMARGVCLLPLGQDRVMRKYWLYEPLPALLVEDWEENVGNCRPTPTPVGQCCPPDQDEALIKALREQAHKNLEMEEKSTSDKENETSEKDNILKSLLTKAGKELKPVVKKLLHPANCNVSLVNGVNPFSKAGKVLNGTGLKVNLSPRAPQKMDHSYALKQPSDEPDAKINTSVTEESKDDVYTLCNGSVNDEPQLVEPKFGCCTASEESCSVHGPSRFERERWTFVPDVSVFDLLLDSLNSRGVRESSLKEVLIEHRAIVTNVLQSCPAEKLDPELPPVLTVRKSARSSGPTVHPNLNYSPGTPTQKILEMTLRDMILEIEEKIDCGMLGKLKVEDRDDWRKRITDCLPLGIATDDVDWGGRRRILGMSSSNMDVIEDDDASEVSGEGSDEGVKLVKELAIAILQVSQGLDQKFLKPPLVETDKLQRSRVKSEKHLQKLLLKNKVEEDSSSSSDEEEEKISVKKKVNMNLLRLPIERWEKSLITSVSISQLFLHLTCLENCISWSKSLTNVRCRFCRKSSHPDKLILCDECNKGCHIMCLKPPLPAVPEGDWFCFKCRPKEKVKSPRKNRSRIFSIDSDEEEEEDEEEASSEAESEEQNEDICDICEYGGELLMCDTCPRSYHTECVDLRKVPRGSWSCPACKESKHSPPDKKKSKTSGSRSQRNSEERMDVPEKKARKKAEESPPPSRPVRTSARRPVVADEDPPPAKSRRRSLPAEEEESVPRRSSRRSLQLNGEQFSSRRSLVDDSLQTRRGTKRSLREDEDAAYHPDVIQTVLKEILSLPHAAPFKELPPKSEAKDYYEVIKRPLDLKMIQSRFVKGKYSTDAELINDLLLIFQNSQQYYQASSPEYRSAIKLYQFFLKTLSKHGLASTTVGTSDEEPPSKKRR